jgi:hypothetical protein
MLTTTIFILSGGSGIANAVAPVKYIGGSRERSVIVCVANVCIQPVSINTAANVHGVTYYRMIEMA